MEQLNNRSKAYAGSNLVQDGFEDGGTARIGDMGQLAPCSYHLGCGESLPHPAQEPPMQGLFSAEDDLEGTEAQIPAGGWWVGRGRDGNRFAWRGR